MRAMVVYESMYGNTHAVAAAIGRGLGLPEEVLLVPVARAHEEDPAGFDLVVVGGPTHVHGMSRESTRHAAVETAGLADSALVVDADAAGEGVREWLGTLHGLTGLAAAFDTRVDAPTLVTGRAAKGIAKLLHRAGFDFVGEPESFLVDRSTHLVTGEEERAEAWGKTLAAAHHTSR